MSDSDIPSQAATLGGLRLVFFVLSVGIGLAVGIFGVYLGIVGVSSMGWIGIYGMSDTVADLMLWSPLVVCLVLLGGLVLGIISVTRGRERSREIGCMLAAVIVCSLGGGLVYLLGWFLFLSGALFHF